MPARPARVYSTCCAAAARRRGTRAATASRVARSCSPRPSPASRLRRRTARLSSAGISGSGVGATLIEPSPSRVTHMFTVPERWVQARDSRAASARRGSPCAGARSRAIASDTASMLRRSRARCQPGLNMRAPSTRTVAALALERLAARRAPPRDRPATRKMPTQRSIMSCSALCTSYGLSPARALERREQLARLGLDLGPSSIAGVRASSSRTRAAPRARAPAEHEQVGERVAAQAVRAVQPGRGLAGGEEPGHRGRARCRVRRARRPSCSASSAPPPSAAS